MKSRPGLKTPALVPRQRQVFRAAASRTTLLAWRPTSCAAAQPAQPAQPAAPRTAPWKILFIAAALLAGTASAAFCAERTFTFSGNSTSIIMKEGEKRTLLEGSASILSESTEITADTIELYGGDFRYARCRGAVQVEDEERGISLTAENLLFDREQNYLRVEGYSEMIDFEHEVVAKSGFMENYGDEKRTVFQIGVRIMKASEDTRMVCRSEYARYNREENELLLTGAPVVFWQDDEYRASRIRINLDTEEITMEGDVQGSITAEEENSNE